MDWVCTLASCREEGVSGMVCTVLATGFSYDPSSK
jgi:hypothetical protein